MANKMLIDATHPEETRVVVLRGNRVQEFDFESANRKQLRGNIYLAKVTRVEPSLQAAFVDYGGNRHGFLAFSEIHPDYYQIPVADRQALLEAERREIAEADTHAGEEDRSEDAAGEDASEEQAEPAEFESRTEASDFESSDPGPHESADPGEPDSSREIAAEAAPSPSVSEPTPSDTWGAEAPIAFEPAPEPVEPGSDRSVADVVEAVAEGGALAESPESGEGDGEEAGRHDNAVEVVSDDQVESVGAEDALEEVPERRRQRPRQYKIQEVIKRRQVLLVQVVKEERGNKGAALTTYLSLAGRYSVLMPNTARGGGISRKITSPADRKKMKEVVADLDVPEGMGVILRTAGASRTKAEVKRDFEYLLRLWEDVRELTLRSTAPTLVYEEGSLIKRSIRDLYNKDIDEVIVAGEDAYKEAKDFMRMLMPSHAKNVKPYRETQPLFAKAGIEAQLDAMFSPQVTLKSGGYLIINQTEALVSIDVNSGRSTREHNIEDTALQTNLEAADEVARQLRLRDLAGLIVIDFIDMEEKRNNRAVERRLKEALKNDRARIQVGRISHFGLLEMSRQRIRTGVLESTTTICPVCQGTGHVRAPSSVALHVLRSLEEQLLKAATHNLVIRTRTEVALYILNQKRANLAELEQRFGVIITVLADETLTNGAHFTVERGDPAGRREPVRVSVQPDSVKPLVEEEEEPASIEAAEPDEEEEAGELESEAEGSRERGEDEVRRRRRRRRGRRSGGERPEPSPAEIAASHDGDGENGENGGEEPTEAEEREESERRAESGERDENGGRRRRRGRRGGRRGRRGRDHERSPDQGEQREGHDAPAPMVASGNGAAAHSAEPDENGEDAVGARGETPVPAPEPAAPPVDAFSFAPPAAHDYSPGPAVPEEPETPPFRDAPAERRPEERVTRGADEPSPPSKAPEPEEDPNRPKKSGWWQRRSFF
ncbi:MAG TPA: Rne/Rng family ribonuclease [Bauldia sp.]|nr:Rne/Rng family ribonuclease [Bauldia sp.]